MTSLVEVSGLRVELEATGAAIVDDLDFTIAPGEVLGLVGESGSGKTTAATALLGDSRRGARIRAGSVRIGGVDILASDSSERRRMRGKTVSYIPQDPAAALNPALRIRSQLRELIRVHGSATERGDETGCIDRVLAEVKLAGAKDLLSRYPHQLSGGQQQRVCIAMAFLMRPRAIVLDEPTTGLDVTTQAHVLTTVRELCSAHDVAALYVSHDLAVVGELAQRVLVMYAGRAIEIGTTAEVFRQPGHPYTRRLLQAIPDVRARRRLTAIPGAAPRPGARPDGCPFRSRCDWAIPLCSEQRPGASPLSAQRIAYCHRALEVQQEPHPPALVSAPPHTRSTLRALTVSNLRARYGGREVLHDVSVELRAQECLALVGESGSGKTTLSRAIVGLVEPSGGTVVFEGQELSATVGARSAASRRGLQYVFQSPYTSLNPRKRIGEIVSTPLRHFFDLGAREILGRAAAALARVELPDSVLARYPHELSGGERQRVTIARALACEPSVLICDEVTSALDVSVQAAIVELLRGLQSSDGLALLFVTHNLALVRTVADRVAVMEDGAIVEMGSTEEVLDRPRERYTRGLLRDTPALVA